MNFYFCETCGARLTEEDIEQGAARNKKLKGVFCAACAEGVMTMETLPLSNDEARKLLKKPLLNQKTSSSGRPGVRPSATGLAPEAAKMQSVRRPRQDSKLTYIVAAGAALVIAVGGTLILGRGSGFGKPLGVAKPEVNKPPAITPSAPQLAPVAPESPLMKSPPSAQPALPSVATPVAPKVIPQSAPPEQPQVADNSGMEDIREGMAQRRLDQIKKEFNERSDDPWTYKDNLQDLIRQHRPTKAGQEAARIIAELKMPMEVAPDSPMWFRVWTCRGMLVKGPVEYDGRKKVVQTSPAGTAKPDDAAVMTTHFKVPEDRPFLQFGGNSHAASDCRLKVEVDGKPVLSAVLFNHRWRTFTIDLSAKKGQVVDIALMVSYRSDQWNLAYFDAPAFAAGSEKGALLATLDRALTDEEVDADEKLLPDTVVSYWSGDEQDPFREFRCQEISKTNLVANWGANPPKQCGTKKIYGVIYAAVFLIESDATYSFRPAGIGRQSAYIDGKRIPENVETPMQLTKGTHELRIVFHNAAGGGIVQLTWMPPGQKSQTWFVPSGHLQRQVDRYPPR